MISLRAVKRRGASAQTLKVILGLKEGFDLDLRVSIIRKEVLESRGLSLLRILP